MNRRPNIAQLVVAFAFALGGIALLPGEALAQAMGTVGDYQCVGGVATGQLLDSGAACPTTLSMDNLFSFLVCNMEQISSNIIGAMYCGMITSLKPAVWAVMTLAVMFWGFAFLTGINPSTGKEAGREAMTFLLRIGLVVAFATQADYIIGYAYAALIGGMRDGISTVLAGIGDSYTDGKTVYQHLDDFLGQALHFATDGMSGTTDDEKCKNAIFAVLGTMSIAFPMLFYLGLLLLARIVITFLHAVFGYLYAIVGIAFLLVLSPFFVTMYMFHTTRPFFDKWLGYLISFSLQMVMLFSFIAFIFMLDVKNMTSNLTDIIMFNSAAYEGTAFRMPWKYCTLCDFDIVDDGGNPIAVTEANYVTKAKLQCKTPKVPIDVTFAASPPSGTTSNSATSNALIKLAGTGIMMLVLLAFIVERILKLIPYLAQKLASGMAAYAPQLGGGSSPTGVPTVRMPGDSQIDDFALGYNTGVARAKNRNSVSTTAQGIKDGMSAMVSGRLSGSKEDLNLDPETGKADPEKPVGFQRRFVSFMVDPAKYD